MSDRCIVFGGSFDPLHQGHIEIINFLASLDPKIRIIVIPSLKHPFKKKYSLSYESRIQLLRKKINQPNVEISSLEAKSKIHTTAEILSYLKKECGFKFTAFVIGSDLLSEIPSWNNYKKLIKENGLIIFKRVGYDFELTRQMTRNFTEFVSNYPNQIFIPKIEILNISSTQMRNKQA
jgi:nicotinate-nucleotide adenylyltransferase